MPPDPKAVLPYGSQVRATSKDADFMAIAMKDARQKPPDRAGTQYQDAHRSRRPEDELGATKGSVDMKCPVASVVEVVVNP